MTRSTIDVIVPVWRHGREAAPTAHSILAAAQLLRDQFDVRLTISATTAATTHLPEFVNTMGSVLALDDANPGALVSRAVADSTADYIAVVEAGDLVDARFLRHAPTSARGVLRPGTAISFGHRTGVWSQPTWEPHSENSIQLRRLMAHTEVWAPTLLASRETLSAVASESSTVQEITAALLQAGIAQIAIEHSVTFIRRWDEEDARVRCGPILRSVPLLADPGLARGAELPRPVTGVRVLPRVRSLAGRLVRPWLELAVARRKGRTSADRFGTELLAAWWAANRIEPLIPFPRPDVGGWAEDWDDLAADLRREIAAYWWMRSQLPDRVDYLLFAPWLRTGGGDRVVIDYVDSILRQHPDASVAVMTTEPVHSSRLSELHGKAAIIECVAILERGVHRDALVEWIVPQLIAQLRPHTIHAFNSTVAFDVVERFGPALSAHSRIFLSTFAIDRSDDGERLSVLFLRAPGFLDPVSGVLVDTQQFVDRVVDELGYSRDRFFVQRNIVDVPRRSRSSAASVGEAVPLRVFWAGRFDLPKRLDVLADIAEASRTRRLPIEFHFYGLEVMGDPELAATLARLETAGAIRHPPFRAFRDLPVDELDAYLLTSEWEGLPLSLLEAMVVGIPAVAPLVGGVGEVLDNTTGYPIPAFDDIPAYLSAFEQILSDEDEALRRADRARARVEASFSVPAFDARLSAVAGYFADSDTNAAEPPI